MKPSNVMIAGGPRITGFKITDFGIAKMAEKEIESAAKAGDEGLTTSQTALGALPYMAPEMIDTTKSANEPADVWALGAMMFELLTGSRPFGQGYMAVPKIMEAKPPPLPRNIRNHPQFGALCSEIHGIIKLCIQKEPEDRPTADDVVSACENLCYSVWPREFGTIDTLSYNKYGFISRENKFAPDVFYHVKSVYGADAVSIGERVWFSPFPGSPRERAFPVVPAIPVGKAK